MRCGKCKTELADDAMVCTRCNARRGRGPWSNKWFTKMDVMKWKMNAGVDPTDESVGDVIEVEQISKVEAAKRLFRLFKG